MKPWSARIGVKQARRNSGRLGREVCSLPELTESTFHIVTGLLLPVWNRLPDETARVYRLQTDESERVIGRLCRQ